MEMHISILHPTTPEYTFFSSIHRTLKKIDHIAEYKGCLKYVKREIIQSMFSEINEPIKIHDRIKNKINNKNLDYPQILGSGGAPGERVKGRGKKATFLVCFMY